ncbi:pfh1 [Symbiodinium pilosum]|uniref:Pfh1 protein n=1 Tax=Symbiodinium pilosum TaxID=2952 RepID=A0A812QM44_SYMPI|nr:pfh1 [Symbiodinium pilosum]
MGSRGPQPQEDNREARRQQLQAERAEEGMGSRGPKPIATEVQHPFPDEDVLTSEKAQANYLAFTRSWGRFGLSRVLLDKLPAGGPSAQWGRMYAVLMEDPLICDVLEGAALEDDGTIFVEGAQGMTPSPARLDAVHRALQELKAQYRLYKANPAVDNILARMAAIQNQEAPQGRQTGESGGSDSSALGVQVLQSPHEEGEGELEVEYLIPKEFRVPKPETLELQKARGISALSDDMDTKFFPHLFPTGTGGWQNHYSSFSQYSRKRLLGLDPRFESSAPYIMWLLEMHTKKRLSGNINVRISSQQAPQGKTRYHDGKSQVFTALRDIPGTHPYVYAKKGVALNMYEQLGAPKFFLTLSCNARQSDILIAVISARLLRLRPTSPPEEIECDAAEILQRYQSDQHFRWDGLSPNQLCNQHPAIVSRQFMHQVSQLIWWLGAKRDTPSHLDQNGDAQDEPEEQSEDFLQAPATDSAGRHRGVRKEHPPFRVLEYIIRIEWQKRGYPHAPILLWVEEWETKERGGPKDAEKAKEQEAPASIPKHEKRAKPAEKAPDPDWLDEEAMKEFVPKSVEDWSDKYICTKSPYSWRASAKISPRDREVNA